MGEWQCPNCGGWDTVAVWEDATGWQSGLDPDYIWCHDCHVIEE